MRTLTKVSYFASHKYCSTLGCPIGKVMAVLNTGMFYRQGYGSPEMYGGWRHTISMFMYNHTPGNEDSFTKMYSSFV